MITTTLTPLEQSKIKPAEGKQNWQYLEPFYYGTTDYGTLCVFDRTELPAEFGTDQKISNYIKAKNNGGKK